MDLWGIFLIAIGLSMDAFAISICKGLSVKKAHGKHFLLAGIWFGGAQAIMPLLGYLLGSSFASYIESIDHWIAFILLAVIGINMIRESRSGYERVDSSFSCKAMSALAIAGSIDALAVGVGFAFMRINIVPTVILIGTTTFIFSAMGIKIGNKFGAKYKSKAELTGGIILIAIGVYTLLDHLQII